MATFTSNTISNYYTGTSTAGNYTLTDNSYWSGTTIGTDSPIYFTCQPRYPVQYYTWAAPPVNPRDCLCEFCHRYCNQGCQT